MRLFRNSPPLDRLQLIQDFGVWRVFGVYYIESER
jgi:hypothetical protein